MIGTFTTDQSPLLKFAYYQKKCSRELYKEERKLLAHFCALMASSYLQNGILSATLSSTGCFIRKWSILKLPKLDQVQKRYLIITHLQNGKVFEITIKNHWSFKLIYVKVQVTKAKSVNFEKIVSFLRGFFLSKLMFC